MNRSGSADQKCDGFSNQISRSGHWPDARFLSVLLPGRTTMDNIAHNLVHFEIAEEISEMICCAGTAFN
jgi:hypothetical protein